MERETGIEPATNSLEGCDSTTELLPPSRSLTPRSRCGGQPRRRFLVPSRFRRTYFSLVSMLPVARHPKLVTSCPVVARDRRERRMVAREGLEPSKPLGRQIYSLLRLTASLPRQLAVYWKTGCVGLPKCGETVDGAGEGIRTPDLLITTQLLYQTELRQPRQKVNFSTSHATLQVPGGYGRGRTPPNPLPGDCKNLPLYSFRGALPYRLEQGDAGGDRDIQTLHVAAHRDRHQPVAAL